MVWFEVVALQRPVIMLRYLSLRSIPHEAGNALRELQVAYSEPINLANDPESGEEETYIDLENQGRSSHRAGRGDSPQG
jgi:hypothetical protein